MISYIKGFSEALHRAIGSGNAQVSSVLHAFLYPANTVAPSGLRISLRQSRISASIGDKLIKLPEPEEIQKLKAFEQEVVLRIVDLTNDCGRTVLHNKTHSVRAYGPYHTSTIHIGATMQFVANSKTNNKTANQSLAIQQKDFAAYLKHIGIAPDSKIKSYDVILPYFYVRERIMNALSQTGMEIEE